MTIHDRISALAQEIDQLRCLAAQPNMSLETEIIFKNGKSLHKLTKIEANYSVNTDTVTLDFTAAY